MNRSVDLFEKNTACHDVGPIRPTGEIHPGRRQPNDTRWTHADAVFGMDSQEASSKSGLCDPSSQSASPKVPPTSIRHSQDTIPQLLWFHESDSSLDSSWEDDGDSPERPSPREVAQLKATRGQREVRFDALLRRREYSITIGDHPGCEDPLPLTLDWAYIETTGPLSDGFWSEGTHDGCSSGTTFSKCDDTIPRDGSWIQIRPLTMAERRYRLIHVGAYTAEEVDAYLQEYYSGGYILSVILELFTRCLPNGMFLGQPQAIQ